MKALTRDRIQQYRQCGSNGRLHPAGIIYYPRLFSRSSMHLRRFCSSACWHDQIQHVKHFDFDGFPLVADYTRARFLKPTRFEMT
jgi:hypothetical protein